MKARFLILLLLALAAAAAAQFWSQRRHAESLCREGQHLAEHAEVPARWVREASADPFLGDLALRGAPASLLRQFRERSRELSALSLLAPPVQAGFRAVALAKAEDPELVRALLALRSLEGQISCPAARNMEADPLGSSIAAAERVWTEKKGEAGRDRHTFARDLSIYCHAEALARDLRAVANAAAAKCRDAKPGTKLARSCGSKAGPASNANLEREMRGLEEEKELNLRKLRQKWPASVVAGLHC